MEINPIQLKNISQVHANLICFGVAVTFQAFLDLQLKLILCLVAVLSSTACPTQSSATAQLYLLYILVKQDSHAIQFV